MDIGTVLAGWSLLDGKACTLVEAGSSSTFVEASVSGDVGVGVDAGVGADVGATANVDADTGVEVGVGANAIEGAVAIAGGKLAKTEATKWSSCKPTEC